MQTEKDIQKLGFFASAVLLALAAACSPADSVPVAVVHALSLPAQVALHPELAPGAGDGHVHEYH
jgi:hypothetical protein